MPLADEVLAGLLKRGERARLRGSDRAIQVSFKPRDSPYWSLSYDERQHCHLRLIAAARAGAVQLQRSKRGGEDRPVEKIRLLDVDALAAFLGTATVSESVREARAVLAPWLNRSPRVGELLDAWAGLKSPRGLGTDSAHDLAAALQVLDALQQEEGEDQIVRVLSRRLFHDSKRIEALFRHLDIMSAESLSSPARQQEEVLAALGLVKEPQPFLVAGTGTLKLDAAQVCPIIRPFIGVSNRHLSGYSGAPGWVLSIENLTTFHQASQHPDAAAGLIVFTGGMPSPSWCRAYACILDALPDSIPVYHWGDIDQGGFKIAAYLKHRCIARHGFHPWLMDAGEFDGAVCLPVSAVIHAHMVRSAREAGWEALARRMLAQAVEQEGVGLRLPDGCHPASV